MNKLTNVPTSLDNLKIKVDDLDVGKLKTVPVELEKGMQQLMTLSKIQNSTQ